MRCETTSPGVRECALCASSACHVHHASVCVNVVIGVHVVLCELHAIVRVHVIPLCGAAVGLTLGIIAHVVVVFVLAILQRIFCIWSILFTPLVGDSKLLLAVTELITAILHQISFETNSTNKQTFHCSAGSTAPSVLSPPSR